MAEAETTQDVNAAGEITTDLFADEEESTSAAGSSSTEKKTEAGTEVEEPAKGTETEGEDKSKDADKTDKAEEPAEGEEAKEGEEAAGDEAKAEETETEEPNPRSAEVRKEKLNNEIRERIATRDRLDVEIQQRNAQVYKPRTEEQLVEEGMDEHEARAVAAEERAKVAEFNHQVSNVTTKIETQSLQVMSEFPEFDPENELFNPDLAAQAQSLYQRVAGLKFDPKTQLVYDAAVFPYDIYKEIALTHRAGAKAGQVAGQKSTEKMLQRAETPSSSAPKAPKKDALTALWDD